MHVVDEDGTKSFDPEFLKYDNDFRTALRQYQEDLAEGRMDPEWQAQAANAMEKRANGHFDDFKDREYESFWGQKQKVAYGVIAGESSKIKLEVLTRKGVFKVDDIWKLDRKFRGKNGSTVHIQKEAKVSQYKCGIPCILSFRNTNSERCN